MGRSMTVLPLPSSVLADFCTSSELPSSADLFESVALGLEGNLDEMDFGRRGLGKDTSSYPANQRGKM